MSEHIENIVERLQNCSMEVIGNNTTIFRKDKSVFLTLKKNCIMLSYYKENDPEWIQTARHYVTRSNHKELLVIISERLGIDLSGFGVYVINLSTGIMERDTSIIYA